MIKLGVRDRSLMEREDCECYTSQMEYDRGEINSFLQGGKLLGRRTMALKSQNSTQQKHTGIFIKWVSLCSRGRGIRRRYGCFSLFEVKKKKNKDITEGCIVFNERTDSLRAGAAKEFLCSLFKSKIQVWQCVGALESSQTKSHRACERL